jgi:predicted dehydrogenase
MHAAALQASSYARAATILDVDQSHAAVVSSQFGIGHVSQSWSGVLASEVDCVAVVAPPATHERLSVEALDAGNMLCVRNPSS